VAYILSNSLTSYETKTLLQRSQDCTVGHITAVFSASYDLVADCSPGIPIKILYAFFILRVRVI
jgi:hypothetical protein